MLGNSDGNCRCNFCTIGISARVSLTSLTGAESDYCSIIGTRVIQPNEIKSTNRNLDIRANDYNGEVEEEDLECERHSEVQDSNHHNEEPYGFRLGGSQHRVDVAE